MSKYDDMPICYIADISEQCNQLAKRSAKDTIRQLKVHCDIYSLDIEETVRRFKTELSKALKKLGVGGMTELEEKIAVMQAFADGKKIEYKHIRTGQNWFPNNHPTWDWIDFDYRIAGEKNFRPYKDTDELINDFCKRFGIIVSDMPKLMLPCIWVKSKLTNVKYLITDILESSIYLSKCEYTLQGLFNDFTFLDDSPCGIKE